MSRIIHTYSPGKRRNQLRRTIAEMLRRLTLKSELDEEAKDMAATLVLALREISQTVEESTVAWEKRNYFLKADRFRRQFEWIPVHVKRLGQLITQERWEQLPPELAMLAPYFKDIRVIKLTRPPSTWEGNYHLLKQEYSA